MEEYVQSKGLFLLSSGFEHWKVSFYKKEGTIVMTENKKKENVIFYPVF